MPRSQDESSIGSLPRNGTTFPPRRTRERKTRGGRRMTTGGSIFRTGPVFRIMVGFCTLFLGLNVLLHSRLEGLHPGDATTKNQYIPEENQHMPDPEDLPRPVSKSKADHPVNILEQVQETSQRHGLADKNRAAADKAQVVAGEDKRDKTKAALDSTDGVSDTQNVIPDGDSTQTVAAVEKVLEHLPIITEKVSNKVDDTIGLGKLYTFRGATENINHNPQHASTEIIDMRQLTATLPFDNPDGGAWRQGWDVQARNVSIDHPLTIFIVPHSHNDPGWIKTFDDYFRTQTIHIITTVVEALEADPSRRFIWAEISYFSWWWEEQPDSMRQKARQVLEKGQLEFVTGGWVMPDEANSQIFALEVQMQEGHAWIRENLGPQYVPKYGWSIDPFGYSPTIPYVLRNFDFEAILIQRVHYAVKKELSKRKHLEFYWRQTWDEDGTYDMFTHLMPFYSYDVPHTCGPDPSVCCQFDYARHPFGKAGKCPWKKDPVKITKDTVAERAHLLVDQHLKKASLYRGNAVLVPLGDDFRYQTRKEAEDQFTNYKAIMEYVNENIPGVTMQFGTLREYFEKIKGAFEPPILKGSFFTYSDVNEDYWSGYFTSRAFDKALDRQLEGVLYAAEAYGAQPSDLREPRRQLSLFQHHDGVTGTAKSHVVLDYAKRMFDSIETTHTWIVSEMTRRNPVLQSFKETLEPCWQAGIPRGYTQGLCADDGQAYAFNPLEQSQMCGNMEIAGKSVATVKLPCEQTGPLAQSWKKIQFDPTTGLMVSPVQEQWMVWKVKQGGAYLFFPETLQQYDMKDVKITQGGWMVETPTWRRKLIERTNTANATVVDFIFEINLQIDNQEWFVRFNSHVKNEGIFHTDLNGFNFDTHYFRADLPIQSQVFPMPTHASIQDSQTRLTVLSEHAQGTASLEDGAIDVFLDRRLRQDDNRGLGQGVKDNVITRTRLRVVIENQDFPTEGEFQITPLCRQEWNKLNHPLEIYGRRVRDYVDPPQPPVPAPRQKVHTSGGAVQKVPEKRPAQSQIDKRIRDLRLGHNVHNSILEQQNHKFQASKADPVPLDATMAYHGHNIRMKG